jgi:uncharacterized membrane protein YphA (DoxX/SURF4 family)
MLESYGPHPRNAQNPLGSLLKTSAILRIGAGIVLMTRHAWDAVFAAYRFLWKEIPWDWVPVFVHEGVPIPHLAAPFAALCLFIIATAWIIGFLTRLFSVLMMLLCIAALGFASIEFAAFSELCWLYLLIAFTLTLFGSGAISLDKLFRIGSQRGKTPSQRY